VIAQNIANSETPGYKAREVSEPTSRLWSQRQRHTVATPQVQLTDRMKGLGAIQPLGAG
jgi:flagellar basal-body rod protein FlgB